MIRLAIIGCGDVTFRRYLPGLSAVSERARVVACCDREFARAERATRECSSWSPGATAYDAPEALLKRANPDAILNLTPATAHFEVTAAAIEAGLHVYSEKPLAGSVAEADELVEAARRRGVSLLCAPAILATVRFRWLRELISAGRIGRVTLATGQISNLGPAAWRPYTGDPTVYYRPGVGPLLDEGIYLLHAITGLIGPARRVQAYSGMAIPHRVVYTASRAATEIEVEVDDHVLVQLDLGGGRLAQVVSSFAVAGTKVPTLELHGTAGSVSLRDHLDPRGSIDLFLLDPSRQGSEGWIDAIEPPFVPLSLPDSVAVGAAHFVAHLQGLEPPLLTAEHARHALEIAAAATESARSGRTVELAATWQPEVADDVSGGDLDAA